MNNLTGGGHGEETLQEAFWRGSFGDEYTGRNAGADLVASNTALFSAALRSVGRSVSSVVEYGCNAGLNLIALRSLLPRATLTGVEINESAFARLRMLSYVNAVNASFYEYQAEEGGFDLALMKGVLIHQAPDALPRAYELLYKSSRKYILIAEYYNPTPVEVIYRGASSVLWKRDFCGEILDAYSDLTLVDYGFIYRRDRVFPMDDTTWFLMEKRGS